MVESRQKENGGHYRMVDSACSGHYQWLNVPAATVDMGKKMHPDDC